MAWIKKIGRQTTAMGWKGMLKKVSTMMAPHMSLMQERSV
jgi:hypothetical protein